jgi:hypothetical protein
MLKSLAIYTASSSLTGLAMATFNRNPIRIGSDELAPLYQPTWKGRLQVAAFTPTILPTVILGTPILFLFVGTNRWLCIRAYQQYLREHPDFHEASFKREHDELVFKDDRDPYNAKYRITIPKP